MSEYAHTVTSRLTVATWRCEAPGWMDVADGPGIQCEHQHNYLGNLVYTGLEHTSGDVELEAIGHTEKTGHPVTFMHGVETAIAPMRTTM